MPALLILLVLAVDAPEKPPPTQSTAIMDVTDRPPNIIERNGVRWAERQSRRAQAPDCGSPKQACQTDLVDVSNYSRSTLRCHAKIHYAQPNDSAIGDSERTVIVPVNKTWTVVRADAPLAMTLASYEVDCIPEPALTPLGNPPECKLKITRPVDPDAYFPKESQDALHEGPVFVEFTLASESATPSGIKVIQTSTYPELDSAAVRMFADVPMTTNCAGKRFRTMVSFRIW